MNERLVGRRGAYSLGIVLLLFAIGLPALAWTGLLSATDRAGKEPAATDRGAPQRVLDQPAVVEGAFRAEASVAREQAEERPAEKAAAERGVREEDPPGKAAAGNADAEEADAEEAVEEAVAAEGEISTGRGGISAAPAVGQASVPAEASASAAAPASASAPAVTTASVSPEAPARRTTSGSPVEAQAASASASAPASAAASAAASAPTDTTMTLEVPAIGVSVGVYEGTGEDSLSAGTGHFPGTGYPWVPGSNTYIAGHRVGYPGTPSDHVFWDLPSLGIGDEVLLTDANGNTYAYAVSEILEVPITDLSVTAPVGGDVVSLQTCIEDYGDYWTEGPNWNVRYVVRAEKV